MIAGGLLLVSSLVVGTWWLTRTPRLMQHDPVSVVIADIKKSFRAIRVRPTGQDARAPLIRSQKADRPVESL